MTMKASSQEHIRPKVRARKAATVSNRSNNDNDNNDDDTDCTKISPNNDEIDARVESTRQRLQAWTAFPKKDQAVHPTKVEAAATRNDIEIDPNEGPLSRENTVPSKQEMNAIPTKSDASVGPKGILRKPKYSKGKDLSGLVITSRETRLELESEAEQKMDEKSQDIMETPRAVISDRVIERDPSQFKNPSNMAFKADATSVEGYTPKIQQHTVKKATALEEPLVLTSMEQLLGPSSGLVNNPQVVEADLSFACMTPEEYDDTVKFAAAVDLNDLERDDEEASNIEDQTPDVFLGKDDIFSDDESNSNLDDDDDLENEDLTDLLVAPDAMEEAIPAPEPRAFLKLWMALKDWITPEAVSLIQEWRNITNKDTIRASGWVPQVDRSDVGASRCAGLMAILKMHLARSLRDLGQASDMKRRAETRLADFLRTLDYSQPMVKLDNGLWRAMTCVLLEMVLLDSTSMQQDSLTLPSSVESVGMTSDEYRYLTRSAIISLAATSSTT